MKQSLKTNGEWPEWLSAVMTAILGANLIAQALLICCGAGRTTGASEVYSSAIIGIHFRRSGMQWMLALWAASMAFTCTYRLFVPKPRKARKAKDLINLQFLKGHAEDIPKTRAIRTALLIAAIAMITAGILNHGQFDVFAKAINICTECIGLG